MTRDIKDLRVPKTSVRSGAMQRVLFLCWFCALSVALVAFSPNIYANAYSQNLSVESTAATVATMPANFVCSAHEVTSVPTFESHRHIEQPNVIEPVSFEASCAQKLSSLLGLLSSKSPKNASMLSIFSSKECLLVVYQVYVPHFTFRIIDFETYEIGQPSLGYARTETPPPKL